MAGKRKPSIRSEASKKGRSTAAKTSSPKSSSAVKTLSAKGSSVKASSKTSAKKKTATGKSPAKKKHIATKKIAAGKKPKAATAKKPGKKASKSSAVKVAAKKTSGKVKTRAKAVKLKAASKKSPSKKAALRKKKAPAKRIPPVKPPFEAYSGIRPFLFVSYAHKNMKDVFRVLKKMYDNRYRMWYDEGIEPGNEWPEVVGRAIVNCSQYLVFMTPAAAVSRNVRNEVNLAFAENKEIIVVYLEETNLTSGMKLQIGTVQHINRYEMGEKEFYEKLFKVLKSDLRG